MLSTCPTPRSRNPDLDGLWLRIQEMREAFHKLNLRAVPTAPPYLPEDFPDLKYSETTNGWIPKGSAAEAMLPKRWPEIVSRREEENLGLETSVDPAQWTSCGRS